MRNHRDRQARIAERARLRPPSVTNAVEQIVTRGLSALRHFNAVVDTPRRAGPSVARAGDDHVALAGQRFDRSRGFAGTEADGLRCLTHVRDPVLAIQQLADIFGEHAEVRLRVVDETHDLAGEARQRG